MNKAFLFLKRHLPTVILIGAVFFVTSAMAYFFSLQSIERLQKTAYERFYFESNAIVEIAHEKYNSAETTLRSLQGFFAGSTFVTRKEFYDFVDISRFFDVHPGFSTLVYVERVPKENQNEFINNVRSDTSFSSKGYPDFKINPEISKEEYWPIVYVYPEKETSFLLGNDQQSESFRFENLQRARDLGDISLSSVVELGQNGEGLILAAPLYAENKFPETVEDRKRLFNGAVTVSLIIDNFFSSVLQSEQEKHEEITITFTERYGNVVPVVASETAPDFLTQLYGTITINREVSFGENPVTFTFQSPARNQLSFQEALEPFLIVIILLGAAFFVSSVIIFSHKFELVQDMKKQYDFVATLSHQLRTPITILRWNLETRKVSEKDKKLQEILMENVLVLNSITQRMLLYIEMSGNDITVKSENISIEQLYTILISGVSEVRDISRLNRVGDVAVQGAVTIATQNVIKALGYIIENALIYSPKEEQVTIEFLQDGRNLKIIISDSGYGIPKSEQKKLFSGFFRATNASLGVNSGSGVSLFMAKKIIRKNGGSIAFTSEKNKGTIFTILIPLN